MIKAGKTNLVQRKMPPGPWKLPLIGNLLQMILSGSTIPHHILAKLAKKHGPIMHLQIGKMSTIVISSPEAAQEAFTTHDLTLAQRPQNIFLDNMTYNNSGVALSPYGTHWKILRKICIAKLLNPKHVQSFKSIREEEVYNFINSISSSSRHDGAINLTSKLLGLNNCIISRATFGKRISKDYLDDEFVSLLNKLMELGRAYLVYQIFPSLKFVHGLTGLRAASENIHIPMDKILQNILDEHKAKRESAGVSSSGIDSESGEENLVDVLLGLQACVDLQFPVTTDAIKAVILVRTYV